MAKAKATKAAKPKKAEKAAAPPPSKRETKRKPKREWKKGDKTPAGCEIVKVSQDPEGKNGHTTKLTIKCLETGKPFDIYTQDAHQTKYHPDVREKCKRRDRAEKKKSAA